MGDDITVDKEGISISWKLFVAAVIAMLGFYVASQVAPLQAAVSTLQTDVARISNRVDAIERSSGQRVPVREAPRRAGDPPVLVAAPDRAMRLLNWQPVHSDLSEIVETAWRWHQAPLGTSLDAAG